MPRLLPLALLGFALAASAAHAQDPALDAADPGFAAAPTSADLPRVEALQSPDGSYTLTFYPPFSWTGAEVEVKGTDGVDLGPAAEGEAVQVNGWVSRKGPLNITLRVATPQKVGVTWQFWVDPTSVPARPPVYKRVEPSGKRRGRR